MIVSELFWNAALDDLKQGYLQEPEDYVCLLCGKKVERGIVYQEDGVFYEAARYMRLHIEQAHGSVFEYLCNLDKKITGLTDHQKTLLGYFYSRKTDPEIQKEMGIKSASTIRNHRFSLKEKERQSKVFLVMMELLKEKSQPETFLTPPKTARMVDDRYKVTQTENDKILHKLFPEGLEGHLETFSVKEKYKLIVLQQIAKRFQANNVYTEKDINQILKNVYPDFATLRRYLIEYGFLQRTPDGSRYWLNQDFDEKGDKTMDRKQELKRLYKETKTEAGVYQIRNLENQKVYIESTLNLKTINGKRFNLDTGTFPNQALQKEWKEFGEKAFAIEVLEILEIPEEGYFDVKDALKKLKEKWLNKLQPYGERGYNSHKPLARDVKL
ncbi:hypothetical protein Desaci_1743 [Desulfosporosinus acidiphilus SJ4]|uniref:DUF2087 domain-containing protein n=1 Tax=Desulfosporosinus acidiphilus (strain DSM 22704 / JCM 16185 / SJ4) TaxID=646529 RepID=I4D4K7_DESAJ|nr:DUF2087 domain-containing protein [Desulfosporosinus acidiphilus]AFM40731.1 hypothetical protein Desaci_1743 [Desulfosporosinus acidiphilus SJ4]